MPSEPFNPWKNFDEFDPTQFSEQSSELIQWPIKLWKAPIVSPYYHGAHLLIAADCTAFACPDFHKHYSRGKLTLICCPEADFDIMTNLSRILEHNDIKSITIVKTEKSCCKDLLEYVRQAVTSSRLPVPVQVSTVFIDAEDVTENF